MLFTIAILTAPLLALLVSAAPAVEKRTTRQAFVGCTASPLEGDTLVTPPSPDGCAYGCAMRGGGYNHAFSYYQSSTNTCICSQHPPLATDYVAPCTNTDYEIYSLTTEFSGRGCRASINGTPATSVNIPYLPWCFEYCAWNKYMYFTPTTGGIFNCYCDDNDFGVDEVECEGQVDAPFGEGAGYYFSK